MSQNQGPRDEPPPPGGRDPFEAARRAMVEQQLVGRGIADSRVIEAFLAVPRHRFVPAYGQRSAYDDRPLPIGFGQTISQPYMVARATELVAPRKSDRALELGAGCGYQAAVLARLVDHVYAVEIVPALAEMARLTAASLQIGNLTIESFDGSGGWPEHAPYDVIIVSAGVPRLPALLLDQLADGGRLVAPVGEVDSQVLTVVERRGDRYETREETRCRYVDLIGRYGVGANTPRA